MGKPFPEAGIDPCCSTLKLRSKLLSKTWQSDDRQDFY